MKKEFCDCCGRYFEVRPTYVKAELRERILSVAMHYFPTPEQLIATLAKEGFRASDVKREMTWLWDQRKVRLSTTRCYAAPVILT